MTHRDQQDGDAEIAEITEHPVHRQEHRLGDEVEPAPVDQQFEAVELERFVVAVDDLDFLGAGEQPGIGAAGGARRNGLRIEQIVGLVGFHRADLAG